MRRLLATLLLSLSFSGALAREVTAQAQNAAPATGRIEGRVTDLRGEPVPAAEVWVQQGGVPVAKGRSDASGAFVLARVPFGALEVLASAPLQVTSLQQLKLDTAAPLRTIALMLPAGTRLSGTVTDVKGAPIAGARVIAASNNAPPESAAMTVTSAEGRYALDTVPLGQVRLLVMAPGFKSLDLTCTLTEPVTQDVMLAQGGRRSLCLKIKNATPEQLAAALCTAVLTIGGRPVPLPLRMRSGVPDARGEWRLDDLPADVAFRDHTVIVPGAAVRMLGRATSAEQVFTAEFAVQPAAQLPLQGLLVDTSGRPMPGHRLLCRPETGPPLPFQTDLTGAFTAPAANVPSNQIFSADPATILKRTTGADPKGYVLMAMAGVGVSCKVSDAQGRPVRGAEVVLRTMPMRGRPDNPVTYPLPTATDAKGVVTINQLQATPPGQNWVMEVLGADGNATSAPFDLPQSGVLELPPLQLTPCGTICGTVRDAAGKPVPFATVQLSGVATPAMRAQPVLARAMLTDRNGTYRFAGLYEGSYTVTVAPQPKTGTAATRVQLKGGTEQVVDAKL